MNIRDIARKAKVSRSTASRVINNVPTVDPRLAQRVCKVIEEVGYRPNHQAQALARGRSRTVGLIVSELSGGNPFFADILLNFERAAVAHGFEVLISFAETETLPDHITHCAERMKERQVDGIAVLTFGMEEQLEEVARQNAVPMVFAGAIRPLKGVRDIRINYFHGMRGAVKHLVEFGHHRIGYLSGKMTWSSMRTRYDALRRAMRLAGVPLDPRLVAACHHTMDGGAEGMANLLNLPNPPTAVLCCNDVAAVGALKTLSLRGLRPGRDISLIGFDDLAICEFTQPRLTTIRFSPAELATVAFETLMEEIQGNPPKSRSEYKTHFVLRESTGPPRERHDRG